MKKVILPAIIFCFLINCPPPVQEALLGEITTDPVTTSVSYRESIALSITTENIDEELAVFTWSADSGTFDNTDVKDTIWTAPAETGTVTISVSVLEEGMASALTQTLQIEVTPPLFSFSLVVDSGPMGSGEIVYASTATGTYENNTPVMAQANPDPGTLFIGWYDAPGGGTLISLDNPYNFTLTADTVLYARFEYAGGYGQVCTVNGIDFNMNYCPGGTFPTGTTDDGEASVTSFWIAETELTYELWDTVRVWAVTGHGYIFANAGVMGDGTDDTNQHPVTTINWRDAMVWTNALTEYYNEQNGQSLERVYKDTLGDPVKNATDVNATQCDTVTPDPDANGFRLPTHQEWECAARWQGADDSYGALERGGDYWTPGSYASGAAADYNDATATQAAGWYSDNSGSSTQVVGQKPSGGNALGLYDMSGNVWEWSFTPNGSYRMVLGGSWSFDASYVRVGYWLDGDPNDEVSIIGFRPVRTP